MRKNLMLAAGVQPGNGERPHAAKEWAQRTNEDGDVVLNQARILGSTTGYFAFVLTEVSVREAAWQYGRQLLLCCEMMR